MRYRFSLFVVCCLGSSQITWGEEPSLGEITVHPPEEGKAVQGKEDTTLYSTVITSEELQRQRTSLPEVLSETVGLQVRRYGGLDDFATVSIRGSNSEQVDVTLDGIPLNRAEGGGVDLSTIPVDQIEKIEVYRGAAPARFGSSSIGGVVNIITRKSTRKEQPRETELSGSYGSFQSLEAGLYQAQRFDRFDYNVGYRFSHSEGDFPYLNDNGTPFNTTDDRTTRRQNNDFSKHDFLTHIDRQFEKFSLTFQDNFFLEERGIPGAGTLTSTTARLETTRNGLQVRLSLSNGQLSDGLDLSLTPFFQFTNQQFRDPAGEIGFGVQDNDNDTFQYGTNLLADYFWGSHQRIGGLLTYRGEQFLPTDFAQNPPSQPGSERNGVSLSLEDEVSFYDARLVLNPQFRTEQIFDHFNGQSLSHHPVSGKIGVRGELFPILTLQTNFSRSYRVPDFAELFGDRGTIHGNENLRPESGLNWDVGATFHRPSVRLELVYFLNHAEDLIQFLQTSQFTVQARNLSRTRIQGVEVTATAVPREWLKLSGNYTLQLATDTSGLPATNGKRLPGRPLHEARVEGTLLNRWGRLFASTDYMDGNFLDSQNILRVNHRIFLGAGLSAEFFKPVTMSFEAKNLLNNRVSDIVGFPLPGRSYYGKVTVRI